MLSEGREKVEHFIACHKEPKRHLPGHSCKHLDFDVEKMEVRQIKREDLMAPSSLMQLCFFFSTSFTDCCESLSEDGLLSEQLLGKCLDNTWKQVSTMMEIIQTDMCQ